MRRRAVSFFFAAFCCSTALAQVAPFNESGVTLGHIHLLVRDAQAQRRFFVEQLGGTAVGEMVRFPGVYILMQQGQPSGPPAGSIINHFGFTYKDLPAWIAKWKAAGVEIEQGTNPLQGYVHAADGVRVEFFGDPSIQTPVKFDHIHFYPVDNYSVAEWYAKVFNGKPGLRRRVATPGWTDCVFVPGGNFSFTQQEQIPAPTAGHAIDHVGFEVKNLDAFVSRLRDKGIRIDSVGSHAVFLTDPFGTRIEVTEGLTP